MTKTETTRKFIPMLYKGAMIRGIQNGTKRITRRLLKAQPPADTETTIYKLSTCISSTTSKDEGKVHWLGVDRNEDWKVNDSSQPYFTVPYRTNDVIWPKETWFAGYPLENGKFADNLEYWYRADTPSDARPGDVSDEWCIDEFGSMNRECWPVWKSAMFMPKSAARLFLEIEEVKVERLQDISQEDAIQEGILLKDNFYHDYLGGEGFLDTTTVSGGALGFKNTPAPIASFATLWQSINGEGSWQANPFVWAIRFRPIEKPADFIITLN